MGLPQWWPYGGHRSLLVMGNPCERQHNARQAMFGVGLSCSFGPKADHKLSAISTEYMSDKAPYSRCEQVTGKRAEDRPAAMPEGARQYEEPHSSCLCTH